MENINYFRLFVLCTLISVSCFGMTVYFINGESKILQNYHHPTPQRQTPNTPQVLPVEIQEMVNQNSKPDGQLPSPGNSTTLSQGLPKSSVETIQVPSKQYKVKEIQGSWAKVYSAETKSEFWVRLD